MGGLQIYACSLDFSAEVVVLLKIHSLKCSEILQSDIYFDINILFYGHLAAPSYNMIHNQHL